MNPGGQSFCLSNPPHLVDKGADICRQCGALAQDTMLGSYQVKRFLRSERGNQAYLAMQRGQRQPVLVKLFPPDPASQHLWERARQELRILAELHHPSMLPLLDCTVWHPVIATSKGWVEDPLVLSEKRGTFLIVIYQYAPVTLQYLIQNKASALPQSAAITVSRLILILEQITEVLLLAHILGAVHGALGPENVLLNAQLDHLWLADFGLARLQLPRAPFLAPELVPVSRVCEQRRDMTPYWEAITEASDQYTLAVLCYQLFLHAVPPVTFRRILPVLQRASHPEPTSRFQRISDFASVLAAELGMGQAFRQGSATSRLQDLSQETQMTEKVALTPSSVLPTGTAPLALTQQADQLEQLAGKHFTSHEYQAALQAYLQTLEVDPHRISALFGVADTYFALEHYAEAVETYGRVLDLDPNNAEAWFNQATVFELLGRADQAARCYERAEQLRTEAARRLK